MKKLFLLMAVSLSAIVQCIAGPADPSIKKTLTLRDGTKVECHMRGDEYTHYWVDDNGDFYLQDLSTKMLVKTDKAEIRRRIMKSNANRISTFKEPFSPINSLTGERKMLVILVDFPDTQFKSNHTPQMFDKILNADGFHDDEDGFIGSVRDYYLDQSYGKLGLHFDIAGPIMMSQPSSYYGADDGEIVDVNYKEMIEEACRYADDFVDYNDYVWQESNRVSTINIIYAGLDQAAGGTTSDIWAKCSGVSNLILDGVKLSRCAISSELRLVNNEERISGIGGFCHELAHGFGIQDMYDQTTGNYGTNDWDLMGTGCHLGNGCIPCGFTAYGKYFFGWADPIVLYDDVKVENMEPLSKTGEFYKIQNSSYENEFYLLENRQKIGWDRKLHGKGMLIMHVDYDKGLFDKNVVNRTGIEGNNHERCGLVLADNDAKIDYTDYNEYMDDYQGDLWPYKGNNALTKMSSPAAILFNKNVDGSYYLGKDITDIRQNEDGTMSFYFTNNVDKNYFGLNVEEDSVEFSSETSIIYMAKLKNLQGKGYNKKLKSVVCKDTEDGLVEISAEKMQNASIDANDSYTYTVEFDNLPIDTLGTEFYVKTYYIYKNDDCWRLLATTKIRTDDLKSNYLTVSDDYKICVNSDNSATLSVYITNHSFLTYNRYVGLYTYFMENGTYVIQTPRKFIRQDIDAYGTENYTFGLENLKKDKTYYAFLFYYPTSENQWKQLSSAYCIIVNDATILADIATLTNEELMDGDCRVYTLSGMYIKTLNSFAEIYQLGHGLYIIKTKAGIVRKIFVE